MWRGNAQRFQLGIPPPPWLRCPIRNPHPSFCQVRNPRRWLGAARPPTLSSPAAGLATEGGPAHAEPAQAWDEPAPGSLPEPVPSGTVPFQALVWEPWNPPSRYQLFHGVPPTPGGPLHLPSSQWQVQLGGLSHEGGVCQFEGGVIKFPVFLIHPPFPQTFFAQL